MYLFILESIGTSELLLIGLIALIVFGPRKLPQMAKTIAKTMAEFKRAGQEFRSTWEREAIVEEEEKLFFKDPLGENQVLAEIKYSQTTTITENKILAPEIKEISQADFSNLSPNENPQVINETVKTETAATNSSTNKQDWL
ncbi:MAG TPA: twin-arginine translocase TatA/TatE family subunit [Pyrinomonadaceae bacterium]